MPVGQSGLNTNNKFVFIMEEAYVTVRQLLVELLKFSVLKMYTIGIIGLVVVLIGAWLSFISISNIYPIPAILIPTIINIIYINKLTKQTYRDTEVKAPNRILFGKEYNIYEINEKDVFDTIMILHEGLGLIKARRELINVTFILNLTLYCIYLIFVVTMSVLTIMN